MDNPKKAADLRRGVVILVILAVFTIVEYILATQANVPLLLVLIAVIKAAIVLQYFMHLPRVFSEEGNH
ncbi:MAG: cytochrome C oxidase subunit IV family protein [Kouleothrix sp.]|jgi:cytochrome c oxidase subunit 4|nr:cytochrome C oxidase subunit IV family protein [Kouleothrix sp.]